MYNTLSTVLHHHYETLKLYIYTTYICTPWLNFETIEWFNLDINWISYYVMVVDLVVSVVAWNWTCLETNVRWEVWTHCRGKPSILTWTLSSWPIYGRDTGKIKQICCNSCCISDYHQHNLGRCGMKVFITKRTIRSTREQTHRSLSRPLHGCRGTSACVISPIFRLHQAIWALAVSHPDAR